MECSKGVTGYNVVVYAGFVCEEWLCEVVRVSNLEAHFLDIQAMESLVKREGQLRDWMLCRQGRVLVVFG